MLAHRAMQNHAQFAGDHDVEVQQQSTLLPFQSGYLASQVDMLVYLLGESPARVPTLQVNTMWKSCSRAPSSSRLAFSPSLWSTALTNPPDCGVCGSQQAFIQHPVIPSVYNSKTAGR